MLSFLSSLHPYDEMTAETVEGLGRVMDVRDYAAGQTIYALGERLDGLYIIEDGAVEVTDASGQAISLLRRGNSFGERGLLADGLARTRAEAKEPTRLICLPAPSFNELFANDPAFRRFFDRRGEARAPRARSADITSIRVGEIMNGAPVSCGAHTTVREAAQLMAEKRISCILVTDDGLAGIVTVRDLAGKVLAAGLPDETPVSEIMTPDPLTLPSTAVGSDVLHMMMERRLGHLPIVDSGRLVGIVTQTDLTRFQANSSAQVVADAARADTPEALARVTARIPDLLLHLVSSGNRHDVVTRLITDIADVVTRRLLKLAEEKLGPPPVPYLWLACGSQGRQEQTGVSDQDNCLILAEGASAEQVAWFAPFAQFVSDGLDACGYVYCPGDMMATNPRWCQPLQVWRGYFESWIKSPSKEAQMLASVMFDLRPIGGDTSLFDNLQTEVLNKAAGNSIFSAHMAQNSLTHQTPLSLLRGLATIRSGEHRDTIDLKMNGVVPIVDLGRMYAIAGKITAVNTRARLEAAVPAGVVSPSGGRDLLDAYDLIADMRLEHQAAQVKRGDKPDNYLPPSELSDFERSHLRDAFVVVKTMQSALMQGRGVMG